MSFRPHWRFTSGQFDILSQEFKKNPQPSSQEVDEIYATLGPVGVYDAPISRVNILRWYKYRREEEAAKYEAPRISPKEKEKGQEKEIEKAKRKRGRFRGGTARQIVEHLLLGATTLEGILQLDRFLLSFPELLSPPCLLVFSANFIWDSEVKMMRLPGEQSNQSANYL